MSPSGPPVTTYCIRALAPGRSGWPSASFLPSSSHSCERYLGIARSSLGPGAADHRTESSPVLTGIRLTADADRLAVPAGARGIGRGRGVTRGATAEHVDRGVVRRDSECDVDRCDVPAADGLGRRLVATADGGPPQTLDSPATANERPCPGACDRYAQHRQRGADGGKHPCAHPSRDRPEP